MIEVLLYFLEQGPTEKTIIEQCVRQKLPLPARIANAPELFIGLEIYYTSFFDLTTCRVQGYGSEGPISWLSIDEYADRSGFEGEQREDLFFFTGRLDATYLEFRIKKTSPPKTKSIKPIKRR